MMKIVFMGTPLFAVQILEKLVSVHEVELVVTQPDQFSHRKKRFAFTPVKEWALAHNLRVIQPEKIKTAAEIIQTTEPDLIVTAAYGQFIPSGILDYPGLKSINVHGSLLPKYRGGAPIQRAIIDGCAQTGISIIRMTAKMDAGEILAQKQIPIMDTDNQETIFEKLGDLGAEMILPVIKGLEEGTISGIAQDENLVSFAPNLKKEDERLDFNQNARTVFNRIRGLNPNPGAYFQLDGLSIKVYNSIVSKERTIYQPGRIVSINKDSFSISCGENTVLSLLEVQFPAGKRMAVRDFLNGRGKNMIAINKEIGI